MKYLLLLLISLQIQALSAQKFSISGKIADESGQALPGATVVLQQPWGELVKGVIADDGGYFVFNDIGKGGYVLKTTMLGYFELKGEITLKDQNLKVGTLKLKGDPKVLAQVEVRAQAVPSLQKGDTTEYNATAFKVMKDANAEELVAKMPGITMENGQMKAHGDNVQQVLVDGKPFFGNDPSAALKNLPAEVIEKVQVFDAQSDQAQFTGFNDGTTTKTINIVTKNGIQSSQFGKVYAGYGYEDKYQVGGNINVFDGNRRISLIGMTNNINVQNFAIEDILGAVGGGGMGGGRGGPGGGGRGQGGRGGPQGGGSSDFLVNNSGGLTQTHAFGLNYSDKWGKKTDVSGSYFFNKSLNNAENDINRQYLDNGVVGDQLYIENSASHNDNLNHRLNFRVEFKIDSMNSLMLRPRLTIQDNGGNSTTLGGTTIGVQKLNASDNRFSSSLNGMNFSNSLLWRHKFQKKGRTSSLDFSTGYAPKIGESTLLSVNGFFGMNNSRTDSINQRSLLDNNSWNAAGNLEYTEPAGKNGQLLLNYRYSYQQEESDKKVLDWAPLSDAYDQINPGLSNVFSNDYRTQQGGLGYNYNLGRELNISARVNAQWADLINEQTYPQLNDFKTRFFNVLPSASLRYTLSKNKNLRLNYRSNTQLPSVDQLQNVVNNSNPLQLTAGNPDLAQSEQHNLFMRYQSSNPTKSTTFFAMLGGGLTQDYIGKSTYLAGSDNAIFNDLKLQPGAQLVVPVNLNGYRNLRSFASYGMPLKPIKSNLNLDLSYNFSRAPGLINEIENISETHNIGGGFTLGSNISEKIDFSISARPMWNRSFNSLQTAANTTYLTQNSRLKFNWQIIEGFVLRTDLTHTLYSGLSDGFNQNYWLWNLGIGKKVFKNERGEITLAINDLLNQNRNIQRSVTETYIEDSRTNALTRFVMLSFTYNLKHINTGKAADPRPQMDERRERPERMWGRD